MALSITGRGWTTGGNFLLANAGQLIREGIVVQIDGTFKSDPQLVVQVVSFTQLKLLGANWGDYGFITGQAVDLFADFNDGNGTTSTLISSNNIQDINGDLMTLVSPMSFNPIFIGSMLPQGTFNSPLTIDIIGVATQQLTVRHNLTLNSNQLNLNSVIDGEFNVFEFNGIDTMTVGAIAQGVQLGFKSGGSYTDYTIERLPDAGSKKVYRVDLTYFLPDYDGDSLIPDWFAGTEALKSVFEISAHTQANNPNGVQKISSSHQLGNTGWYNEEHNQGINDFTITSLDIYDAFMNPIQNIDYTQVCNVSLVITGLVPPSPNVEVRFDLLPDNTYYKNNQYSHHQNRHTSYINQSISMAFGRAGEAIALQNLSTSVSGNSITVNFQTTPNPAFVNFINNADPSQKNYRFSVTVQNATGINNCVSLLVKEGQMVVAPIPDQPYKKVKEVGFITHPQVITDVHATVLESRTEDDIVFHSLFWLDKNVPWEELRLRTFVRRISDGAEFDLESKIIPFAQFPSVGGVLQFNYNEYLPQFLDSPERNKVELRLTGASTALDYEVELIYSMFNNWRYWLPNNNAFLDFYDLSLPNFGRSNEWVRYMQLAGYEIWTKGTLVLNGIGYYFEAQNIIKDYDEDFQGTTVINLYDENGTPVNALIAGQTMTIEAVHTLTSDTWQNPWGWISIRPYEDEINKRISTVWNWSSQDLPLLPETGNTVATLTIPSPNVAVVRAMVNTSGIDVNNVSIIARIEDMPAPCVPYLEFMVSTINATVGDYGGNYYLAFLAFMESDISEENICCPQCFNFTILTPQLFDYLGLPTCCLNETQSVDPPHTGYDPCTDSDYYDQFAFEIEMELGMSIMITNSSNPSDIEILRDFLFSIPSGEAYSILVEMDRRGIYFNCSDEARQHGFLVAGGGRALNNVLDLIL